MGVQVFDYFDPKHMNRCLHQIEIVTILKTLQLCHSTLIGLFISLIPEDLVSHWVFRVQLPLLLSPASYPVKGENENSQPMDRAVLRQTIIPFLTKHVLVQVLCSSPVSFHITIANTLFFTQDPLYDHRDLKTAVWGQVTKVGCTIQKW